MQNRNLPFPIFTKTSLSPGEVGSKIGTRKLWFRLNNCACVRTDLGQILKIRGLFLNKIECEQEGKIAKQLLLHKCLSKFSIKYQLNDRKKEQVLKRLLECGRHLKCTSCRFLELLANADNKITSKYEYALQFELLGISEYAFPLTYARLITNEIPPTRTFTKCTSKFGFSKTTRTSVRKITAWHRTEVWKREEEQLSRRQSQSLVCQQETITIISVFEQNFLDFKKTLMYYVIFLC